MIEEMDHPKAGRVRSLGIAPKLSDTPGTIRIAAPTLGQHTAGVLQELLAVENSDIERLQRERIII